MHRMQRFLIGIVCVLCTATSHGMKLIGSARACGVLRQVARKPFNTPITHLLNLTEKGFLKAPLYYEEWVHHAFKKFEMPEDEAKEIVINTAYAKRVMPNKHGLPTFALADATGIFFNVEELAKFPVYMRKQVAGEKAAHIAYGHDGHLTLIREQGCSVNDMRSVKRTLLLHAETAGAWAMGTAPDILARYEHVLQFKPAWIDQRLTPDHPKIGESVDALRHLILISQQAK